MSDDCTKVEKLIGPAVPVLLEASTSARARATATMLLREHPEIIVLFMN
jgi:hypothetical protein